MIRTSLKFASHSTEESPIAAEPGSRRVGGRNPGTQTRSRGARFCDYGAPAGLFIRTSSGLRYRGFENAALALRHANEVLSPGQLHGCIMEVGDARYTGEELPGLYRAAAYPVAGGEAARA